MIDLNLKRRTILPRQLKVGASSKTNSGFSIFGIVIKSVRATNPKIANSHPAPNEEKIFQTLSLLGEGTGKSKELCECIKCFQFRATSRIEECRNRFKAGARSLAPYS